MEIMKIECNKNCRYQGDKITEAGDNRYHPCTWCKHDNWNKKHISENMLHDHYTPNNINNQ